MAFADQVDQFFACQDGCGWSERFEAQHGSDSSFDETVILFNDVIEVFSPDHNDQDRVAKIFQHLVDCLEASSVCTTFVDDNLAWQSVHLERAGKELRRSGLVSALGQHDVQCIAVFVNRSVKVKPIRL